MPTQGPAQQLNRKRQIEDAALKLFLKQGFHGVGLREVARVAKVSLGNLYNHYTGKELLFTSLLNRLYAAFAVDALALGALVGSGPFPGDLVMVGKVIGGLVDRNRDYLTLLYVDIAEFDGHHARPHYENLAGKFSDLFGDPLTGLEKRGKIARGIDPAVAFTLVYLMFTNYFVLQRCIGAQPFGLKEDKSIAAIARILTDGLKPRSAR